MLSRSRATAARGLPSEAQEEAQEPVLLLTPIMHTFGFASSGRGIPRVLSTCPYGQIILLFLLAESTSRLLIPFL